MNIDIFKEELDKAILLVKKDGWTIKDDLWVRRNKKYCCPMGAMCLVKGPKMRFGSKYVRFLVGLGITRRQIDSFTAGFDNYKYQKITDTYSYWKLGKQYRNKYIRDELPPRYFEPKGT